jgi:hypothetical protein
VYEILYKLVKNCGKDLKYTFGVWILFEHRVYTCI